MQGSIFSESWFKVASLQVSLQENSYIRKQIYRGQTWYIIEDSYNNHFFKIKPEAYEFITRLNADKTIEEIWEECLEICPNIVPSQDEVISILTSLHHKNLLYFKNKTDNEQLIDRANKRKISEIKGKLFSFLYIKVPLFDPDKYLDKMKPFIEILLSKKGFTVWLITLLIAIKYVIENFSLIYDQTQGMLSPDKLFLLYISTILLKSLHELGHSMMVKKYGGRVNTIGVMILIFTPLPFMDATQSWRFRSKYQRALVGASGMFIEFFIAAIATIIWANTGDGLVHSISFNMMIIGSVSSLFFNGNPLLKFDSYFILSDLLEIPNLQEQSKKQWYYLVQKYIFKLANTISPSLSIQESSLVLLYAVLSYLYRLFIAITIALFIADEWFAIGVLIVMTSLYLWVFKPFYTFLKYLTNDMTLQKVRFKVIALSIGIFSIFFIIIVMIPFPFSIKASGIILNNGYSSIYIKTDGFLKTVYVRNGEKIKKGDLIASFENKDLDFEIEKLYFSIKETDAYMSKARTNLKADVVAIEKHLELLDDKLTFFKKKKSELNIIAKEDGYFIYENIKYREETWYTKGNKIGTLIPLKGVYFQAVIPQEEAWNLFRVEKLYGTIKLYGVNKITITTDNLKVIPYYKQELPSAVLGWLGGGSIATSNSDTTGRKTMESFFEVRADITDKRELNYLQGRSGILKIYLDDLTLYQYFILGFKQLLQKHYKI